MSKSSHSDHLDVEGPVELLSEAIELGAHVGGPDLEQFQRPRHHRLLGIAANEVREGPGCARTRPNDIMISAKLDGRVVFAGEIFFSQRKRATVCSGGELGGSQSSGAKSIELMGSPSASWLLSAAAAV